MRKPLLQVKLKHSCISHIFKMEGETPRQNLLEINS